VLVTVSVVQLAPLGFVATLYLVAFRLVPSRRAVARLLLAALAAPALALRLRLLVRLLLFAAVPGTRLVVVDRLARAFLRFGHGLTLLFAVML
jgi:hypothetical protein